MCAGARTHCRCTAGNALAIALTPHVSACHCANVLATADTPPPSACHCEPVRTLAWQSASPQRNLATWHYFGQIRYALRIRPKCCFLSCPAAGDADCPVASLLAMAYKNPVPLIPGRCRCTAPFPYRANSSASPERRISICSPTADRFSFASSIFWRWRWA